MTEHVLKIWPEFFKQILTGVKEFEYRRNDRDFYEGDILVLREYDPYHMQGSVRSKDPYTGRYVKAIVQYIWGLGWTEIPDLPDDFVIMKIKVFDYQKSNWKTDDPT